MMMTRTEIRVAEQLSVVIDRDGTAWQLHGHKWFGAHPCAPEGIDAQTLFSREVRPLGENP